MTVSQRQQLIAQISALVDTAAKFKNAYFFSPPGNANGRRSYEKQHTIPEFSWEENGNTFTAKYIVDCSCKNVYAYGMYTKNGSKTTLTAIKNSLKRLQAETINLQEAM